MRTKYISKAKRERQAFRQSQPCGVPVRQEPDIKWQGGRMIYQDTPIGKELYQITKHFMWIRDRGLCCICGFYVSLEECTFEHFELRAGGHRNDQPEYWRDGVHYKNGVAHGICNSEKGSRRGA